MNKEPTAVAVKRPVTAADTQYRGPYRDQMRVITETEREIQGLRQRVDQLKYDLKKEIIARGDLELLIVDTRKLR